MDINEAKNILSHIVAQTVRWGKQYDGSDIGLAKLMAALLVVAKEDNSEVTALRKELATSNRQKGAGEAREMRYKKRIEELQQEVDNLKKIIDKLGSPSDTEQG